MFSYINIGKFVERRIKPDYLSLSFPTIIIYITFIIVNISISVVTISNIIISINIVVLWSQFRN